MFPPKSKSKPRILVVTPEITALPPGMGNMADQLRAKAGGLADVSASLVGALYRLGADIHVALPHYRKMFQVDFGKMVNNDIRTYMTHFNNASRIHLAEDRIFYYRDTVYSGYTDDAFKQAIAFQREVINNIIPQVDPDLIHCNDWMTGLIPGAARRLGIPCLFTVHNIHTYKATLEAIEDRGLDTATFWRNLYYERPPWNYEETRSCNPVDMLTSGIFGAHFINTVSPTFLKEIVDNCHAFIPPQIRNEIAAKYYAGCASGILNSPDESENPETDSALFMKYNAATHKRAKQINKITFQEHTGLHVDQNAPLFFWPNRLDPVQKGCSLLTDILYETVERYRDSRLQIAVVANGSYQRVLRDIVAWHNLYDRVTVCDFDESLSHLAMAAADFILMPSLFEPCGLPQMSAQFYGTLPVVRDTGGLHDTVEHFNFDTLNGNGFVFKDYDDGGLRWGIEQAMRFYALPEEVKARVISRVMTGAKVRFTHDVTAQEYMKVYEAMLARPLIP